VLPGRPRGGDPQVGLGLRKMQALEAVHEHRRRSLPRVQSPGVDLADVSDEVGLGVTGAGEELGETAEELVVGDGLQLVDGLLTMSISMSIDVSGPLGRRNRGPQLRPTASFVSSHLPSVSPGRPLERGGVTDRGAFPARRRPCSAAEVAPRRLGDRHRGDGCPSPPAGFGGRERRGRSRRPGGLRPRRSRTHPRGRRTGAAAKPGRRASRGAADGQGLQERDPSAVEGARRRPWRVVVGGT